MANHEPNIHTLIRYADQRHLYHECVLMGRSTTDAARVWDVSRSTVHRRTNKYAARHGLPKVADIHKNYMDDDGRECSKCSVYRPWSEYRIKSSETTRHESICKVCLKVLFPSQNEVFNQSWEGDENGCWVWYGKTVNGYPYMTRAGMDTKNHIYAHRLVLHKFCWTHSGAEASHTLV